MWRLVWLAGAIVLSACTLLPGRGLHPPPGGVCRDGLPMKVLTDETCPGGICGFSCLPGRWRE